VLAICDSLVRFSRFLSDESHACAFACGGNIFTAAEENGILNGQKKGKSLDNTGRTLFRLADIFGMLNKKLF